jgi:hypothetical protein
MTCDHVEAMCIYQCIINVVVVSHTDGETRVPEKNNRPDDIYRFHLAMVTS